MAQGATSNGEIVLSDEDFEHSHSIRLLLDLLVDGVVGRKDYRLNHIADAFDLTLKYDCHCGYLLCLAYIDQAFKKEPMDETLCEIFILSGELNEMRLVKVVVYEMARTQHKYECDKPAYFDWGPSQLGRVSPTHLWALSQAFHATLSTDSRRCYLRYPHPEEAADKFEELMHGFPSTCTLCMTLDLPSSADSPPENLATPEQLRGASCRAQNPWATK